MARVASVGDDFSKSERRIVEFFNRDPGQFARASVKEIAAAVDVSEPTIVRFCRRLGYDGFKDFKIQLVQDLAFRQAMEEREEDAAGPARKGSAQRRQPRARTDGAEAIRAAAETAIERASDAVDWARVEEFAKRVAAARRIVILGLGGSSAIMALELHNRLFRLGLAATPHVENYMQRMAVSTLERGDVAIFISSTGRPAMLYECAELARYYGVLCVGVAPSSSLLGRVLDVCIDLELTQGGVSPLHPNPMRYAQLFLIDCIAVAVAQCLGPKAEEALKRARGSVASIHGLAPHQPVGD